MGKKKAIVELADVVEGLRNELEKAQKKGEGKDLRFGVKGIELEFDLTVVKEVSANGAMEGAVDLQEGMIKYLVGKVGAKVAIAGGGKYQKVSSQKVKMSLSLENAGDSTPQLSGESR